MSLKDKILTMRDAGKTYREIADELGCSKSTVSYHVGTGQKEKTLNRSRSTKQRRFKKVSEMKNVPCIDCGNSFPSECMDFDHVRGEKVERVSQLIMHGTWQSVLDEIDKCEVVCANCHRIRTKKRGNLGWGYSLA